MVPKPGEWTFFDDDPMTGMRQEFMYDAETGKCHIKTVYTATDDLLSQNSAEQVDGLNQKWGEFRKVASVPINIASRELWQAVRERDERFLSKWLNDPDHSRFRTFRGRV
jgi:hypothetical protein